MELRRGPGSGPRRAGRRPGRCGGRAATTRDGPRRSAGCRSRRHAGWPTDTSSPPSASQGRPAATSGDDPSGTTWTDERSQGMSGWSTHHGGQPTARWIESRCAVEVVAGGQDRACPRGRPLQLPGRPRRAGESRRRRRGRRGPRGPPPPRRRRRWRPDRRGPPLPVHGLARERPRRAARPGVQPHALIGQVHVGERTRPVAGRQAARSPAVVVDPAADAHPLRREVHDAMAGVIGVAAHEDDAASLERPGLQPVDVPPVRTDVGQRHLSRGGLRSSQR